MLINNVFKCHTCVLNLHRIYFEDKNYTQYMYYYNCCDNKFVDCPTPKIKCPTKK